MNYIFFDTECASHAEGISRICSFGYVICDSEYNILEKSDIIINPKCDFDTESFEKSGFRLAYPEAYFRSFPDFSSAYGRIRRLLTSPDLTVIGHSAACDASYIAQNIALYGLPYFDFTYLDTQKMHICFGGNESVSLKRLCEIYSVPLLRGHKSDDDAEMTARIAEAICRTNGVSLEDIRGNNELRGVLHDGVVHDDLSAAFPIGDGCHMTNSAKRMLRRYLSSKCLNVTPDPFFVGKKYCFDENFENTRFCELIYLIGMLRHKGAEYVRNVPDCNVFVDFSEGGLRGTRFFSARHAHKKIIPSDKLLNQLGINEAQLSVTADMSDRILGNTVDSAPWLAYYNEHFK